MWSSITAPPLFLVSYIFAVKCVTGEAFKDTLIPTKLQQAAKTSCIDDQKKCEKTFVTSYRREAII